jgi:hypothetical protein
MAWRKTKSIAIRDHGRQLKALTSKHRPLRAVFRNVWALVHDIAEQEFVRIDEKTYKPRRPTSWEALTRALSQRFRLAAAGRVEVEKKAETWTGGLPLYEAVVYERIAAVLRRRGKDVRVAEATACSTSSIDVKLRGTVISIEASTGMVAVKTVKGKVVEIEVAEILIPVSKKGLWKITDLAMLDQGDSIAADRAGRVRLVRPKSEFTVLVFEGLELAAMMAHCLVEEPCCLAFVGPEGREIYRCDFPIVETVALLNIDQLDVDAPRAGGAEAVETVKVRPKPDGTYTVLFGHEKVEVAKRNGQEELPVVIQLPARITGQ